MIKIVLVDSQALTYAGIIAIFSNQPDFEIIGKATNYDELDRLLISGKPNVIIIDQNPGDDFDIKYHQNIRIKFDHSHILLLANKLSGQEIKNLMDDGIRNLVSKDCAAEEIVKAVYSTAKGKSFICQSISNLLETENSVADETTNLSSREKEIVSLIAAGVPNKEIAAQLFLSIHTIKTHRKNIIKKIGFGFKNINELTQLINKGR